MDAWTTPIVPYATPRVLRTHRPIACGLPNPRHAQSAVTVEAGDSTRRINERPRRDGLRRTVQQAPCIGLPIGQLLAGLEARHGQSDQVVAASAPAPHGTSAQRSP